MAHVTDPVGGVGHHRVMPPTEPRSLLYLHDIPVTKLRGVGDARAKALAAFGIENVFDLLTHYPRRYIDRTKEAQIRDLAIGEVASVLAQVTELSARRIKGGRVMVTGTVRDPSGTMKIS